MLAVLAELNPDPARPETAAGSGAVGARMSSMTTTSFRSMDVSTAEQWAHIADETFKHQDRVATRVLSMLDELAGITDGFAVRPARPTACRPRREPSVTGADDEMIVASLCHDIGKVVSVAEPPGDRRGDPQALRAQRGRPR